MTDEDIEICEYCGLIEGETCECWNCEHCMCKEDHEPHYGDCPKEGTYYGVRSE